MGSAANLLFTIGANADEAQTAIARFRQFLSGDLDAMGAKFQSFSDGLTGMSGAMKGGIVGVSLALIGSVIGTAKAAQEATERYAAMVEQIDDVSDRTGIAAEDVSRLRFAAEVTTTDFGALTNGLGIFSSQVVKAAGATAEQTTAFDRLGISRAQVAAGEKNLMPLLEQVMDKFQGLASDVDRAAMARDLFSRGGAQLLDFLNMGSEGLRKMGDEARRLGMIITNEDVKALEEYKATLAIVKAQQEALDVVVGRRTLPVMQSLKVGWAALMETLAGAATGKGGLGGGFIATWAANAGLMQARVDELAKALGAVGKTPLPPDVDRPKVAAENYYGLSQILMQVRGQLVDEADAQGRANFQIEQLQAESAKAIEKYTELRKEGKLTAEAAEREAQMMATLPGAILSLSNKLTEDIAREQAAAVESAGADLRGRIAAQREKSSQEEYAGWAREIDELRTQMAKKHLLTGANADALAALDAAGRQKIAREQGEAYAAELVQLQGHLAQMVAEQLTSSEKLGFQYDLDLQRYSEAQLEKTIAANGGEADRWIWEEQFAINRDALLQKYGTDLIALQNSQGWQGVLGSRFGSMLRGNEAAMREWATANSQALMMVRLQMVALGEMGRQAFAQLSQGMGANIAHAVIYEQSIGKAMRAALAATLETIAAESMVQAIYSTALGFKALAQHDYAAAASAFQAAGIFALVGGAAAVAGRFTAAKDAASAGAGGQGPGAGAAGAGTGGQGAGDSGPRVTVVVNGNLVGWARIEELTAAINDAVLSRDVRLVASGTTTGEVVRR